MAKKSKNNIVGTLKNDVKALSFQAGYNALKDALVKMIPETSLGSDKLEGLVAGAVYYYFMKNERYGKDVSMAVRLEALGDVIQTFGENIPGVGSLVKTYVNPLIEGDEDENIKFIEGLRNADVVDIQGYNPQTDSFDIQGSNNNSVNIIESL